MFTQLKHIWIPVATSKAWAKGLVIQSMKKRTVTKEVCQPSAQSPLSGAIKLDLYLYLYMYME